MDEFVYNAFNGYFQVLEKVGYMKQKNIDSLLILNFLYELIYHDYRGYIKEEDYRIIEKALNCLYGTNCLIPYPDYLKMGKLHLGDMTEIASRFQEIDEEIKSIIVGGVALKQNFGDEELFGISQKVLTDSRDDIQAQIDAIISDKATVSLTASTGTFIVGSHTFTLTASTNTNAESIVIKQGNTVITTGSGKTLSHTIDITQATAGNITYTAEFTFAGGNKKTTNATIYFVDKIYVGSGTVYTDVTTDAYSVSARRSPTGTYNVTVALDTLYVWFVIPATMTINKAIKGGFDFPLEAPQSVIIESVAYKVYRSSNTYDAGTETIILS